MLGAIFGDFVGSKYEFNNIKTTDFELIADDMTITDDSILTIAVAEWLLLGSLSKDRLIYIIKNYVERYPHPMGGYGVSFSKWAKSDDSEPYNSWGNGSAMRVAAVGWAFDTLERTEKVAALTAEITHNHPEGIKGAQAVAAAIFMARNGSTKRTIKRYITDKYGYDLTRTCDEIRPTYSFNESCAGTVPEAIIAFLDSEDFESAIRLAISLGGDSDTLAAITGGIAEAFYGMDSTLPSDESTCGTYIKDMIVERIPRDLRDVLDRFNREIYPSAKKFMAKNEARTSKDKINWQKEKYSDYALTPEQYAVFMKSYQPDWDCRHSVHYEDGFHYITRSFFMLKKFRYELMGDGLYHIKEYYTNPRMMGSDYMRDMFLYGYFERPVFENIKRQIIEEYNLENIK